MIQNIKIEFLEQHPENPRSDVGDITELAASIKENGILQNLTVVEQEMNPGYYYVVIGNRRLAASKEVGLEELPCSIKVMDKKTQIGTMLLENMQREDLTPYEQAQGFQMMMDLGDTVATISEKTGFSETTIRHRIKLTELDQETLLEKSAENITITDLIKLEQIEDADRKNEALKKIGTNDFDWAVRKAVQDQQEEKIRNYVYMKVDEIAEPIVSDDETDGTEDKRVLTNMYLYDIKDEEKADNAIKEILEKAEEIGADKIYYERNGKFSIGFYRDKNEDDIKKDEEKEEKTKEDIEREERALKRREIFEAIDESTEVFVLGVSNQKIRDNIDDIVELAALNIVGKIAVGWKSSDEFEAIIGIDEDDEDAKIEDAIKDNPSRALLLFIYKKIMPSREPADWNGYYDEDSAERFLVLYRLLDKLGYRASEEELNFINGKHDSYEVPDEDEVEEYDLDEEADFDEEVEEDFSEDEEVYEEETGEVTYEPIEEEQYDENYFDERD